MLLVMGHMIYLCLALALCTLKPKNLKKIPKKLGFFQPCHHHHHHPTGLPHDNGTGPDLSRSSFCFLVSHFYFLFISCGRLSWLPVSFLLHVKYTLSYRIVSYHCKGVRCPPIFSLSNLINVGWLVRKCVDIYIYIL